MHGYNYLRLDKHRRNALEVLNRKAMRFLTGLSAFTTLTNHKEFAHVNVLMISPRNRKIASSSDFKQHQHEEIVWQPLANSS